MGGCSCCGLVNTARFIAVLGILVSGLVIAPPAYVFFTGRDPSELLVFLKPLHRMLEQQYEQKAITESSLADLRQLLNDISEHAGVGTLVGVSLAGTNILLDLLLLIGTCCRIKCLVLPWLVLSLLQILILGCPTVIFFSLLGTYLLVQGMLIPAICSFSTPSLLVLVSMLVWLTVLAAYWNLNRLPTCQEEEIRDTESVQPLMAHESQGGHAAYNLGGHYPHYYPPPAAPSGPSAPPQTTPTDKNNPNLYPTLPA